MDKLMVLVCGGRDYKSVHHVYRTLDEIHNSPIGPITHIITGAARNADTLGLSWANTNEIPFTGIPAQWTKHGKAAVPARNQAILDLFDVDLVVAFPGGRGTNDMITRAKAHSIPIEIAKEAKAGA
jgi:hypothetical protein